MLINYEILTTSTMEEAARFPTRRILTSASTNRPSTCSNPERASSAVARCQGPASRVYRNMQRQIYKLWYDQAIPPAKALAYLHGRTANPVMFTVSGQPVTISSTSINLQPKVPDATDMGKTGFPDVKASTGRAQTTDIPFSTAARSSFRETSKKSLLSPAYYAASTRGEPVARRNCLSHQETLPAPQNGLMINAQSVNAVTGRSAALEPGLERSSTIAVNEHGDSRLDRDEDEVDGCIVHVERRNMRSGDRPSPGAGNESDQLSDGILVSSPLTSHKSQLEEPSQSRATTANNFSRRTRPFSSMTSVSCKSQSKSIASDIQEYPDPCSGGPSAFQQRIADIASLENETLRYERMKASRRKPRPTRQD